MKLAALPEGEPPSPAACPCSAQPSGTPGKSDLLEALGVDKLERLMADVAWLSEETQKRQKQLQHQPEPSPSTLPLKLGPLRAPPLPHHRRETHSIAIRFNDVSKKRNSVSRYIANKIAELRELQEDDLRAACQRTKQLSPLRNVPKVPSPRAAVPPAANAPAARLPPIRHETVQTPPVVVKEELTRLKEERVMAQYRNSVEKREAAQHRKDEAMGVRKGDSHRAMHFATFIMALRAAQSFEQALHHQRALRRLRLLLRPIMRMVIARRTSERLRQEITAHWPESPPPRPTKTDLAKVDLLQDWPEDILDWLAERFHPVVVQEGAVLLSEGMAERRVFILCRGSVRVVASSRTVANVTEPYEVLGELSAVTEEPHAGTVEATGTSCLWAISTASFLEAFARLPPPLQRTTKERCVPRLLVNIRRTLPLTPAAFLASHRCINKSHTGWENRHMELLFETAQPLVAWPGEDLESKWVYYIAKGVVDVFETLPTEDENTSPPHSAPCEARGKHRSSVHSARKGGSPPTRGSARMPRQTSTVSRAPVAAQRVKVQTATRGEMLLLPEAVCNVVPSVTLQAHSLTFLWRWSRDDWMSPLRLSPQLLTQTTSAACKCLALRLPPMRVAAVSEVFGEVLGPRLAAKAVPTVLPVGAMLFSPNAEVQHLYYMASGSLAVVNPQNAPVPFLTVSPGFIGLGGVYSRKAVHAFGLRTQRTCEIWEWSLDTVRGLLRGLPAAERAMLKARLADRF